MNFDNHCMKQALEQAHIAFSQNEVPVGAVIADRYTQKIIAKDFNRIEQSQNPTHHAEILAISKACMDLGTKTLSDCDLYVTLEPCAMCASAISHARIGRVFYGTGDSKFGAVENGVRFFTNSTCHHRPEIYVGILEDESSSLLKVFFKTLRSK